MSGTPYDTNHLLPLSVMVEKRKKQEQELTHTESPEQGTAPKGSRDKTTVNQALWDKTTLHERALKQSQMLMQESS